MRKLSPTIVVLFVALALTVGAKFAWAEEGDSANFGGCVIHSKVKPAGEPTGESCNPYKEKCPCVLEAGPSVAVTVAKYEGGRFSGGVMPGIGYGFVLFPERWYALGLAAYGQLVVGGKVPNQAALSGLFSFAHYVRLGIGSTWTEQEAGVLGPAARATSYLFGLGSDLGRAR